jgi:hypothetical protein
MTRPHVNPHQAESDKRTAWLSHWDVDVTEFDTLEALRESYEKWKDKRREAQRYSNTVAVTTTSRSFILDREWANATEQWVDGHSEGEGKS